MEWVLLIPFGLIAVIFMENQKKESPQNFKQRMLADLAQVNLAGIPAKFILAVASLETGNGIESHLSESNNPFNIHAIGNQPFILVGQEHIRQFSSFKDAISHFVSLISQDPRYAMAYSSAQAGDAYGFFYGLQSGGYAANPQYASSLMGVYNSLGVA